jgi:hypothetical protein
VGVLPVPLNLEVEYDDGSKETYTKSAECWKNQEQLVVQMPLARNKTPIKATLGGKTIPDSRPKDNVWKAP